MSRYSDSMDNIEAELASFLIVEQRIPTIENQIETLKEMRQRRMDKAFDHNSGKYMSALPLSGFKYQQEIVKEVVLIEQYIKELQIYVPEPIVTNLHFSSVTLDEAVD